MKKQTVLTAVMFVVTILASIPLSYEGPARLQTGESAGSSRQGRLNGRDGQIVGPSANGDLVVLTLKDSRVKLLSGHYGGLIV
jgi:hypothetical protein